jgi:hypothetical protein
MLSSHELFGFMSPKLATDILDYTFQNDRDLYRLTVKAVAEAKKLRPVFLERKPRVDRDKDILSLLTSPRLEVAAGGLLRGWLLKKNQQMLIDFLNGVGIAHENGVVEDLPQKVDEKKIKASVDALLAKYPREEVAVYLNAFLAMNEVDWGALKQMLENDPRLQFGV